jgi:polysaccharide export outer membrane protein
MGGYCNFRERKLPKTWRRKTSLEARMLSMATRIPPTLWVRAQNILRATLLAGVVLAGGLGCKSTQESYPPRLTMPVAGDERPQSRVYSDDLVPAPGSAAAARATTETLTGTPISFEPEPFPLGPGDVVEVIYQLRNIRQEEAYKLEILDEIEISFFYTPRFNRQVVVRPDGKVEVPVIGEVQVTGLTTREIEELLVEAYAEHLKNPIIQVRVLKSNTAIEELKRAITTSPRGQSRLEPVRPDGFISLPLIGDVMVAGLTTDEARLAVTESYNKVGLGSVDVTVVLLEVKSPIVYMMGEVARPGPVVLDGPTDVWGAVAMAGGFTNAADPRDVLLAKSRGPEAGSRQKLNFLAWREGDVKQTSLVRRGDTVYVPRAASRFIYVGGEVDKPGSFELGFEDHMTVSMAIAAAGGITFRAREAQVLVLRKSPENDPIILAFDLNTLFNIDSYNNPYDTVPADPRLQPGDVVFVPRRPVGAFNRFATTWFRDGIWTILPFSTHVNYTINN